MAITKAVEEPKTIPVKAAEPKREVLHADRVLAESVIAKVGRMYGPFKLEELSKEEWALLNRFGVKTIEKVPFESLKTDTIDVGERFMEEGLYDTPSYGIKPFFLRLGMVDGNTCAMTQAALREILNWESKSPQDAGQAIEAKFYRFETFKVDYEPKYKEYIKGEFGAILIAHLAPYRNNWDFRSVVWANGYPLMAKDGKRIYWEWNDHTYFKHQSEYRKYGAWSIRYGHLGKEFTFKGAGKGPLYYVNWTCCFPPLDEDTRPNHMSSIQIAVSAEDFARLKKAIDENPGRMREVIASVFPEVAALAGMGIKNSGLFEVADELNETALKIEEAGLKKQQEKETKRPGFWSRLRGN